MRTYIVPQRLSVLYNPCLPGEHHLTTGRVLGTESLKLPQVTKLLSHFQFRVADFRCTIYNIAHSAQSSSAVQIILSACGEN